MIGRELAIKIRTDARQALNDIKAVKQGVVDFQSTVQRNQAKRDALDDVGGKFTRIGLAATLAGAVAVKSFADFDQAIADVRATGSDARVNIDELRDSALKLGAETKYSATEAARGMEELLRAGVSAKDVLAGGLKGSLDLAAAGNISVADSARIAATTMTQFGLAGSDVPHVADVLAAAAGKAQGGVDDLGLAMEYVGPVASQMGISLEETAGSAALLANSGILADKAGTSLRAMLTSLTSPSAIASRTMEQYGISLYDTQGNMIGLEGIAGQLKDRLGGLGTAERDVALGRLFGNETITAARILYAGGADAVRKWTNDVNDSGYAADTAAERMDSFKGDLEQLKGALETAFIGTGGGIGNSFRPVIQAVTDLIGAFDSLPGSVQSTLGVLGGAGALALVTVGGFMKLSTTIAESRIAMDTLSKTSPALAGNLGRLTKAAGVASIAFTALSFVHSSDGGQDKSIRKTTRELERMAETGKGSGEVFSNWNKSWLAGMTGSASKVQDLGDALDALSANWVTKTGKWSQSKFGVFDSESDLAADSFKKVDLALQGLVTSGKAEKAQKIFDVLAKEAKSSGRSVKDLSKYLPEYTEAMDDYTESQDEAGGATRKLAKSLGLSEDELKAQDEAAAQVTNQFESFGQAVDVTKMKVSDLVADFARDAKAMSNLAENTVVAARRGLDEGVIQYLQQKGPEGARLLADLATGSDAAISKANRGWRERIDAAAELKSVLVGFPADIVTKISNPGARDAIQNASRLLRNYADQPEMVETILRALDYSTPQIKAIMARLAEVDGTISKAEIKVINDSARDAIAAVKSWLDGIPDESVNVRVKRSYENAKEKSEGARRGTSEAHGGVLDFYANGGVREDHVAQIAPAGSWRVFAEPETGGEGYIPLAQSKRQRSLAIWAEIGRRFGVQGFANGGTSGASAAPAFGPGMPTRFHITSGALRMEGGEAYVSGIAEAVYEDREYFDAGNRRAGRTSS